jgi:D-cysteine desulfhydrase family pyridoxal phosphate-dependent enzyme
MPVFQCEEIQRRVGRFRRVDLIHLPTPFRKLERLSAALGGPTIFIKRDDLTGLAFGGNKSRKLEFIMGDMLAKNADAVITWASLQSNWCMQTAAAAREFGIRPVLMLFKTNDFEPGPDGNLLLDTILDADIRFMEAKGGKAVRATEAMGILEETAAELRADGFRPYLVPVGGSLPMGDMEWPLGAISYVNAFAELAGQAEAEGTRIDAVVHSTGSGGTQAGLVVGARALSDECRVVGISVSDPRGPFSDDVLRIARAADDCLGLRLDISSDDVIVFDDYIREGYGVVDRDVAEVIRLVFQKEGIVLDPVYTAKAMVGLADLVRKSYFKATENVVFVHTGGTPALFPSRKKIVDFLAGTSQKNRRRL